MKYFGMFKDLRDLQLPNSKDFDLYEGYYANFYEALTFRDDYDIPYYMSHLAGLSKEETVLELACGSGRIIKHIANKGWNVVGLEYSNDMIKIAEDKLKRMPDRIRNKVSIYQGDMQQFNLNRTFPLILLTATSISLLESKEAVLDMFNCVYNHLEPGGRFIFDYITDNDKHNVRLRQEINAVTLNISPMEKQFVLLGEQTLDEETAVMNFYAEVARSECTERYFGSTMKKFYSEETLVELINKTDFSIVDQQSAMVGAEEVKFLVLERGGSK